MFKRIICKIERYIVNHTKAKDNYIVFESAEHHIFDNSYYLYKYFKNNKKLKLFYVVYNNDEVKEAKSKKIPKRNVLLIDDSINVHTLKTAYRVLRTKKILRKCSLCFISYRNFYKEFKIKFYNNQTLVNLRHGQFPIKNVTNYYKSLLFNYDANVYFRVGTEESISRLPYELKELNCKWFGAGMPRCDCLKDYVYDKFLKVLDRDFVNKETRIYLSMTTFRNNSADEYFKTQFPIKVNDKELESLNKFLIENNSLFIIKVHHDNVIYSNDRIFYSNIILIDDNNLEKNGLFVNDVLQYVNMLITDFSSVLFDYFYFDKPIAFITVDIDNYQKTRGLYNTDFLNIGPHINNIGDLKKAISSNINSVDIYKDKRTTFSNLYNGINSLSGCEQISNIFLKR